ncbi:MAG: hypothetical protein V4438_03730 [Patescibacteria group bacterium]
MKAIRVILSLALIFLAPTISIAGPSVQPDGGAYEGEPPASLPIASKAMQKAFNWSEAHHGYAYIWSESLLTSFGEIRNINVTGKNADDVLKKLSSSSFQTRTYDKSKPVYIWSYLSNDDGDQLFQSNFAEVKLIEKAGVLTIQSTPIELQMAGYTPIEFPNAVSARIEHVGANGEKWEEELQVYNGKIYYPSQYGRTDGTLIVTSYYPLGGPAITPGESLDTAYDLSTGDKSPTTLIAGNPSMAIENHLYATDVGYASASQLIVSKRMIPPVDPIVDQWTIVAPPTAMFNVNSTPGKKRVCKVSMTIKSSATKLGVVKAWAYDPNRTAADGTVQELGGTITTSVSGQDVLITSTWNLDNDVNTAGGSDWIVYFEIDGYEVQGPPTAPYYDSDAKS